MLAGPGRQGRGAGRMLRHHFAGQTAGLNCFRLGGHFIKASQQQHNGHFTQQEVILKTEQSWAWFCPTSL